MQKKKGTERPTATKRKQDAFKGQAFESKKSHVIIYEVFNIITMFLLLFFFCFCVAFCSSFCCSFLFLFCFFGLWTLWDFILLLPQLNKQSGERAHLLKHALKLQNFHTPTHMHMHTYFHYVIVFFFCCFCLVGFHDEEEEEETVTNLKVGVYWKELKCDEKRNMKQN